MPATITGVATNTIEITKKAYDQTQWLRVDCGGLVILVYRDDEQPGWPEVIVDWPEAAIKPTERES